MSGTTLPVNRGKHSHNRWRIAFACSSLSCVLATSALAGQGYLSVGKPTALRFHVPSPTRIELKLPPVKVDDVPDTETKSNSAPRLGNIPPFAVPGSPLEILFTPATDAPFVFNSAGGTVQNGASIGAGEDPMVRDMIVDYFVSVRSGTNDMGEALIPVRFTPPAPVAAPESRATYRTR